MTKEQIQLINQSWAIVATIEPEIAGELFYNRLFTIAPQVKPLFRSPMPEQSRKLMAMLNYIICKLDTENDLRGEVVKLAQRHATYHVKEEYYSPVGEALLWTLEKALDTSWHTELKEAWVACYKMLSEAMIEATNAQHEKMNVSHPATI